MPFWVYILECKSLTGTVTYYTGSTNNIERRLSEHRKGRGARYTSGKRVELMYWEEFATRRDAMRREIAIKRLPRVKKSRLIQLHIPSG